MQSCYCGQSNRCNTFRLGCDRIVKSSAVVGQQRPLSELSSRTSSQCTVPSTRFVKSTVKKADKVFLGLGHSKSELGGVFSRRNSTTTQASHCSSCCSSCSMGQAKQQSRFKVLSWASERTSNPSENNTTFEHTANRRFYEQRACADLTHDVQGHNHGTADASSVSEEKHREELQRLFELQQFRLLNASECFSAGRQDALRLQRVYNGIGIDAQNDKWHKDRENKCRQQFVQPTSTTPYVLRQKMLQLRLRAEEAERNGNEAAGSVYPPMNESCALKYNCK